MAITPVLPLLLASCLEGADGVGGGRGCLSYPLEDWEVASPESQGVDSRRLLQAAALIDGICGKDGNRETVIVRNGRVIWQGASVATRHPIWSCTKSFTSTCLGLLWDDGKLTPETLVASILPQLAAQYPTVTLEHLATFTSGYNHAVDHPGEPTTPRYQPGAALEYSLQSDLLAQALTRVAGEPLKDLFMRRIGAVIGLAEAEFQWGVQPGVAGIPAQGGAGLPESGVHMSARALARFGWLFCQRGRWRGRQLISTRYIDYATVPRVLASVPPFDAKAWYTGLPGRYGLNWWVNGIGADGRRLWPSVPASSFAAQGNMNNICIIVPEWDLVVVRGGMDEIIDVALFDGALLYLADGLRAGGGLAKDSQP